VDIEKEGPCPTTDTQTDDDAAKTSDLIKMIRITSYLNDEALDSLFTLMFALNAQLRTINLALLSLQQASGLGVPSV